MVNNIAASRKNQKAPKYAQVMDEITRKILSNEWADNCRIPTESELCEMFGVSRITVRKALDELQAEGYLVKIQGKGTYTKHPSVEQRLSKFYSFGEELKKKGMEEWASIVDFSVVQADSTLAEHLQIVAGSPVYRLTRVRSVTHGPYALEISYIPQALVRGLTRESVDDIGLYKTMANCGVVVDSATETFSAVNTSKYQSELLNTRIDAAAIALCRTTYSGSAIVEYCESVVRGDFFSYTVELN